MSRGGLLQCANNRPNLSQTRCGHGPPTRTRTSGIAQPVVQRSTHRLPCLFDQDGRQRYPSLTCQALLATGCALHAYVLMDNHLHLLVTKPKAGRVAHHMQTLGFNAVVALTMQRPASALASRQVRRSPAATRTAVTSCDAGSMTRRRRPLSLRRRRCRCLTR
jgi:REP element-mobilizing transposase RayT